MGFFDYLRMVEAQICAYSILTAGISIYFLSTLFPSIIIDTPLSVLSMMFFLLISIGGFLSIFSSYDRVRVLYVYFLLAQIILSFVFIIVTVKTVDENEVRDNMIKLITEKVKEGDFSIIGKIQKSMKCCFYHDLYMNENMSLNENFKKLLNYQKNTNGITIDFPLPPPFHSCCSKLDSNKMCYLSKAYKSGCQKSIMKATKIYKITTIVLFILSLLFQCFLFYSYLRNARY